MKYLASGGYSKIFETGDGETVIVYSACELKPFMCQLAGMSPHYPLIWHVAISPDKFINVYRAEKLYTTCDLLVPRLYNIVETMRNKLWDTVTLSELNWAIFREMRLQLGTKKIIEDLLYAYEYLSLFYDDVCFDLKFDNILARPDGTLILNDPFFIPEQHDKRIWDYSDEQLFSIYAG